MPVPLISFPISSTISRSRLSKGSRKFNKVIQNLRHLAKIKVEAGESCRTSVGVGVIINPLNVYDLVEIAKRIKEIDEQYPGGIQNLAYRPTVRYVGGVQENEGLKETLEYIRKNSELNKFYAETVKFFYGGEQFPKELFNEALRELNKAKDVLRSSKVSVTIPTARIEGVANKVRPFKQCLACPLVVFISADGTVYNCVELGLNEEVNIGSLKDNTFDEIWHSEKRRKVLDFLAKGGMEKMCPPVCLLYEYNIAFDIINEAISRGGNELKEVGDFIRTKSTELNINLKKAERRGFNFMYPAKVLKPGILSSLELNRAGHDIPQDVKKSFSAFMALAKNYFILPYSIKVSPNLRELAKVTGEQTSKKITLSINPVLARAPPLFRKAVYYHEFCHLLGKNEEDTRELTIQYLTSRNLLASHIKF